MLGMLSTLAAAPFLRTGGEKTSSTSLPKGTRSVGAPGALRSSRRASFLGRGSLLSRHGCFYRARLPIRLVVDQVHCAGKSGCLHRDAMRGRPNADFQSEARAMAWCQELAHGGGHPPENHTVLKKGSITKEKPVS